MKNVIVLSKSKFDSLMVSNGITDDNVEISDYALISIRDGDKNDFYFTENHKNVLNLNFGDTNSFDDNYPFTMEMGRRVIEFIQNNEERSGFIVHCSMGKCRSGAIGTFISDYFGNDYNLFKIRNPQVQPNILVLRTLRKLLNEK